MWAEFSNEVLLLLWHLVTLTCVRHRSESFTLKPPPRPLVNSITTSVYTGRLSVGGVLRAADSPAMSLFVLVMDSNLPLSSKSPVIDGGKKFTFFSPLPLSFNRARGTSSSYSSDNVRCSFFFSYSLLYYCCFILYQQTVTLNVEGVLSGNKVRSVWR